MIKETKEGLKILVGENGKEFLFMNSDRLSECINYLHDNNLRYIIINSFQDYKKKDITFLNKLKDFLEGLSVLDTYYSYEVINELHKLKYLGIPDNGKDIINLRNFPDLEVCGISYSPRLKGLEFCKKLKSLTISNYTSKTNDLTILPSLENLEHLSLINTKIINLNGIENYNKLMKFEIFKAPKLLSIEAIIGISNALQEIKFENCKNIDNYEIIGKVKSLKKIFIIDSGKINSLKFITDLPNLELLSFWGTNVLDGNLKYCEGIKFVGFNNKKHYSHNLEYFRK